jgi:hypothetical protein
MRRIGLAVVLAVSLTLASLATDAQPPTRVAWDRGFLGPLGAQESASDASLPARLTAALRADCRW